MACVEAKRSKFGAPEQVLDGLGAAKIELVVLKNKGGHVIVKVAAGHLEVQ